MARVVAANSPIHDHDLAYARYLLDGYQHWPELAGVADTFYDDANRQLVSWSQLTGHTVEQCAGVTALYSIQQSWNTNLVMAHNAIVHGLHASLPLAQDNARAILAGEPVYRHLTNGPKVNNFFRSLLRLPGCRGANDRWIFRVFNRPQGVTWYTWVDRCLDVLAGEYGLDDVSTLQSRLWHMAILDLAMQGDRGAMQSATMLGLSSSTWYRAGLTALSAS